MMVWDFQKFIVKVPAVLVDEKLSSLKFYVSKTLVLQGVIQEYKGVYRGIWGLHRERDVYIYIYACTVSGLKIKSRIWLPKLRT